MADLCYPREDHAHLPSVDDTSNIALDTQLTAVQSSGPRLDYRAIFFGQPFDPTASRHSASPSVDPPSLTTSPQSAAVVDSPPPLDAFPFLPDDFFTLSAEVDALSHDASVENGQWGSAFAPPSTSNSPMTQFPPTFDPNFYADLLSQDPLSGSNPAFVTPGSLQSQTSSSSRITSSSDTSLTPSVFAGFLLDDTAAWLEALSAPEWTASLEAPASFAGPSRSVRPTCHREAAPYSTADRPSSNPKGKGIHRSFEDFHYDEDQSQDIPYHNYEDSCTTPGDNLGDPQQESQSTPVEGTGESSEQSSPSSGDPAVVREKKRVSFGKVGGLFLGQAANILDYMQGINPVDGGGPARFPRLNGGHRLVKMQHCLLCGTEDTNPRRHLVNSYEHTRIWQRKMVRGDPNLSVASQPLFLLTMFMLFNSEHMESDYKAREEWDFQMLDWDEESKAARETFIAEYADVDFDQLDNFTLSGELARLIPHLQHWASHCIAKRTCKCGREYCRPDAARRCPTCGIPPPKRVKKKTKAPVKSKPKKDGPAKKNKDANV